MSELLARYDGLAAVRREGMRMRIGGQVAWIGVALAGASLAAAANLEAQLGGGWTVRPEWVRAHEQFLASDALAGRGSATRDEQIAAEYVASEFIGYGLKAAPGMSGYLQRAEVVSPVLDGAAVLQIGGVTLKEGTDFRLLTSSGGNASGLLVRIEGGGQTRVEKGAAVLFASLPFGGKSMQASAPSRRAGAALIVLPADESTEQTYTMFGGKTRVPMRLKEADGGAVGSSTVALTADAMTRVRGVVTGQMASLTVHPVPQAAARTTYNAVGYLEGSDPASGTVLLTAHLDHLGVGRPVDGDPIYNGANDDAAGTTAVLEIAHALAAGPKPRRNVLFVCYGSEEVGELGSTYFGEHPPVPLTSLVANLEFEMIGNQDPKMPKGVLLLTGWERSNLGPALKEHGAFVGPDPYPEQHFFERSDNYALALKGVVAHTAAGWGTVPTYHQPSDDLAHLDLAFMTSAIQSLVEPVRWLAMSDFKPEWNKGGQPKR